MRKNAVMNLALSLSLSLSLSLMAAPSARADGPDDTSAHVREMTEYRTGLRSMGDFRLGLERARKAAAAIAYCGLSSLATGGVAVLDSIPVVSLIPKAFARDDSSDIASYTISAAGGGVVSGTLDVISVPLRRLMNNDDRVFILARTGYGPTSQVVDSLFSKGSSCVRSVEQYANVVAERQRRSTPSTNAVADQSTPPPAPAVASTNASHGTTSGSAGH